MSAKNIDYKHIEMSNKLTRQHNYESPQPLHKIVNGHLRRHKRLKKPGAHNLSQFWPARFFGLDKNKLFQNASDYEQNEILSQCARAILNETYFFEKSGLNYCAKMILLGEDTEQAQNYGMMADDEATHLQWITPYTLPKDRINPIDPFLKIISHLIEECDPDSMIYLIQIISEGWLLDHYQRLSKNSLLPDVASVFKDFVRDELLHHHSGVMIFDAKKWNEQQYRFIQSTLTGYAEMLRIGPHWIVRIVESVLGTLNQADRERLFEDIDTQADSAYKLELLKKIALQPGLEKMIGDIADKDGFTPYNPLECAQIYQQMVSASFNSLPKAEHLKTV